MRNVLHLAPSCKTYLRDDAIFILTQYRNYFLKIAIRRYIGPRCRYPYMVGLSYAPPLVWPMGALNQNSGNLPGRKYMVNSRAMVCRGLNLRPGLGIGRGLRFLSGLHRGAPGPRYGRPPSDPCMVAHAELG